MRPPASESPAELAHRFETGLVSREEFGHREFLLVVAWLLLTDDEARATERIVSAMRRLERSGRGVRQPGTARVTGPARRGYNETITLFWIGVASRTLPPRVSRAGQVDASNAFASRFARHPDLIYEYYSPHRVHSLEARMKWIEPDLRALDTFERVPSGGD
ncbi:MAG: hypothetical protein ACF8Q5_06205 [Phycisphaerales bacterium JB040]